jgi:16S rRNA G966 N2-methylase RsmD
MPASRQKHPLVERIPADRQGARRHYGVHPYFTRRPYNVVRRYILHYSNPGDRVLDPFGGSGVTGIEAFLANRTGIHNDLNPLANFIAGGIVNLTRGPTAEYRTALAYVRERCERSLARIEAMPEGEIGGVLAGLELPPNTELPSTADVRRYHDLFTPRQLACLAVLRAAVERVEGLEAMSAMRLAWSATLAKLNRTFISAAGRADSRGGSSIFSIYRYKVAAKPVNLPAWATFEERACNILAAKEELDGILGNQRASGGWRGGFELHSTDVEELVGDIEPVDYIFTDPPYGGHIGYLDLSTLWNVWLGRDPADRLRRQELIVGGEQRLSEERYLERLARSVEACFALLRKGAWMSIAFQHWNVAYFRTILLAAAACGGDLRAAVSQVGDPIWSMHKKKSQESVLAGDLLLTFQKTGRRVRSRTGRPFDAGQTMTSLLQAHDAPEIHGEYLFNRLVVEAWKASGIDALDVSRHEVTGHLRRAGWMYDEGRYRWVRRVDGMRPEQARTTSADEPAQPRESRELLSAAAGPSDRTDPGASTPGP